MSSITCHLLKFWLETPTIMAYWVQPPGVAFCCVIIVDGERLYGCFRISGMMLPGRNVAFLIINAAK